MSLDPIELVRPKLYSLGKYFLLAPGCELALKLYYPLKKPNFEILQKT